MLFSIWLPELGGEPLDSITPERIRSIAQRHRDEKQWAELTYAHAINRLSRFSRWAVRSGYAKSNPCVLVARKQASQIPNQRRYVLPLRLFDRLLATLEPEHPALRDLCEFCAVTGMRQGRATGLTPEDFDGRLLWFYDGKAHAEQAIPLAKRALALVRTNVARGGEFIFSGPRGGRIAKHYLCETLHWACTCVGIPYGRGRDEFSFHSLRRLFATSLLNDGVGLEEVRMAGGWKTIDAVERYAIASDRRKRELLARAERALRRR